MRRFTLATVMIATACAAPTFAQQPLQRRAPLAADAAVRITNMVGSVRVIGWERDSIVVAGTVEETKTATFLFHASAAGAKLGIWDEAGDTPGPSHLEVRVPMGSIVWVKTASADVTVQDVTGGIDVYSVAGRVTVNGSPRQVHAESLSGEIRIDADTRAVHAKTATSAITLLGSIADATASTVSGVVTLEGLRTQRGRFESVDSDIIWAGGDIDGKTTLDFITHAGAVELRVPGDAAADFVIATFEGGFDDRLGVRTRRTGSALKGIEIQFRIGDPGFGGQVTVRSFKGRVLLSAR
jgi:DUF4097 and DUF4098 domain-containing protein YvlB